MRLRPSSNWLHRTLVMLVCVLAVHATATRANAQSVGELSAEVGDFEQRIKKLEEQYLRPAMLASKYKLEARFNDARVAHSLQDYRTASILLVDVVQNEKFRAFESFREALFLLGDSLYQQRNYLAAHRYFERLMELGPGSFYQEAGGRLLEIAYQTRNFERLDTLYSQLSGGQGMGAAVSYLSGKAYFEQGRYDVARDNFSRAAQSPDYAIVAEYFRGVSFVADRNLAEAKRVFRGLVERGRPTGERDLEVLHLTWLALGRVAYEEGEIEQAIDHYARIPRTSPHFDRALWEQTWALVTRGNFEAARRNTDIITFLEDPDPDLLAEAKLLRADLSLKLGEYETARQQYQGVLDTFTPVAQQMDEFMSRREDLTSFFGALVREELHGAEPDYMPPLVQQWVQNDPDMRAATRMLADIRGVDVDIRESYRLLDELSARLSSSTRIQSFPQLADGLALGVAAETRLVEIRQLLLDAEFEQVQGRMAGPDKERWKALRAELDDLRRRFDEMPQSRSALAKRERAIAEEFDRLRRRLDRVGFDIDAQKAQLQAVDTYVENDYGRPMSKREKQEIKRYRDQLRETVSALSELRDAIEHELELSRQRVGLGDQVMAAEQQVRVRYRAKLGEAKAFLARHHGSSPSNDVRNISNIRARLEPLDRRLGAYFAKMDEFVEERVSELREDIAVERELVDAHRLSVELLVSESQTGAGVLAYVNFMRARAQFNEVILRGDVGLLDVAWRKKDDVTSKIQQLFEDRTSELKLLQESFEEVR